MSGLPTAPPDLASGPAGLGRRALLRTLLGGLGALAACRTTPPPPLSRDAAAFRRRLIRDYRFTSSRTYSEEGIPVFLAGDDLTGSALAPEFAVSTSAKLGTRLATDLRRAATVLGEARLATAEADLGKLIEVFAARDFGSLRQDRHP